MTTLAHAAWGARALVSEGRPAAVLLHGFLGSARNLSSLAQGLAGDDAGRGVVALDLTGHGASPPLPPGADLAVLARDVLDTVRRVLTPPVALVGHSLGGRVALRAALLEPFSVAAVVLLDITPSPRKDEGETAVVVEALLAAPAAAGDRAVFREHFLARGLSPDVTEWLLTNLVREGPELRWRIDRGALAALRERAAGEDLWPAVEGPRAYRVGCVRGARSPYVGEDDARRLRAAGAEVDTVAGAGHFLHVTHPAEVRALVTRALG